MYDRRINSNLAEGGVEGVGEAFGAQARVQKGAGKALGTEIAEGGFWRALWELCEAKVS